MTKQINLFEGELGIQLFVRTHRGLMLTEAGKSFYRDAQYILQYCSDSIERAKKAMQDNGNVIRIGTSPMDASAAPCVFLVKASGKVPGNQVPAGAFCEYHRECPEILKNLGQNIDVVAGIFDETMLNLRQCAGLEISREPICCAVSLQHPLAKRKF